MAFETLSVCEAFDRTRNDWRALLEARIKEIGDPARARRTQNTLPETVRIRDVLLASRFDEDESERKAFNARLDREFSEERLEFRVRAIRQPDGEPRAFLGYGVFAPDDDDLQVADLEFAWNADPEPAVVMTPRLGGRATDDPAAWYAGQSGVAVGFHPDLAPAVLDRSGAPPGSKAIHALEEVVLFFGRRQGYERPSIEAHAPGGVGKHLQYEDWWLRNGQWQWLELDFAEKGVAKLWFRVSSRTGRINFRASPRSLRRSEPAPGARPRPVLILHGLVVPNPPSALRLLAGFLTGRPSRVIVAFDDENRLRSNEISETRNSVVIDQGGRLAIWRHRPPGGWIGRWRSMAGWQNLELDLGERIELLRFPPTWPKEASKERKRALRLLYRRGDWSLLRFEGDGAALGWFAIGVRAVLNSLPEPSGGDVDAAATLSLDWLNRAGCVVSGGRSMGLAEHHAQYAKVHTEIVAEPEGLRVIVGRGDLGGVEYLLEPGRPGPVGPLFVEYRIV